MQVAGRRDTHDIIKTVTVHVCEVKPAGNTEYVPMEIGDACEFACTVARILPVPSCQLLTPRRREPRGEWRGKAARTRRQSDGRLSRSRTSQEDRRISC